MNMYSHKPYLNMCSGQTRANGGWVQAAEVAETKLGKIHGMYLHVCVYCIYVYVYVYVYARLY
jgi:hypothetical protein